MNLMDLYVKIGVDDKASSEVSNLSEKMGNGLKTAAKVGAAAVSVAAAGVVSLAKSAIQNYSEYEQLVGGVDTLFKESSNKVQEYASNAYKTAGMSANDYMNTVTGFSASLLQSLGGDTEKATEYANTAITDMSDNANKMGTDISSIQTAYQGFAKQNYTMLDNLKLGYGGTKEEMQRLIDDANKMNAAQGNYTNYTIESYADVVSAIHDVQTEMDITGTTAKEASTTIQGSVSSMKSAWSNLITGIADDNQDFGKLIENFVESVSTAASNILPRISTALSGIGDLITSLAPVIAEAIPSLLTTVLPDLLNSAVTLLTSFTQAIVDNLPVLIPAAFSAITTLVTGMLEMLPDIVSCGLQIIISLINGITESLPTLIPTIVSIISEIFNTLTSPDMLSQIIIAAIELIITLAQGLVNAIPNLVAVIPQIIQNVVMALIELLPELIPVAIDMIVTIAMALTNAIPTLLSYLPQIFTAIIGAFAKIDWGEMGRNIIQGLIDGIKSMVSNLNSLISDVAKNIKDKFKSLLGIASPSKVFKSFGKFIDMGLGDGITGNIGIVSQAVDELSNTASDFNSDIVSNVSTTGNAGQSDYVSQNSQYQNVALSVSLSSDIDNKAAMGLARYLLPFIKVAEREAYA